MTVPQPQPPQSEAQDRMRVIAAAGAIAHHYRSVATATPKSDILHGGRYTPHDLAITFWQTPAGYGWQITIYRQEGTQGVHQMCDLTCMPGSASVDATWEADAGPYLAALAFDLDMRLLCDKRAGKVAA